MGTHTDIAPRIYVACLASYNAGVLHGEWIDCAGKDKDDLQDEINAILRSSPHPNVMVTCSECDGSGQYQGDAFRPGDCPTCKGAGKVPSAEEWAIHDHEDFYGCIDSEYPGLDAIVLHASMLEKHGLAWAAYVEHVGAHYATEEGFEEAYCGEMTLLDYAYEYIEGTGALKALGDHLSCYFDYEAFARDLGINDMYEATIDGQAFLFNRY